MFHEYVSIRKALELSRVPTSHVGAAKFAEVTLAIPTMQAVQKYPIITNTGTGSNRAGTERCRGGVLV